MQWLTKYDVHFFNNIFSIASFFFSYKLTSFFFSLYEKEINKEYILSISTIHFLIFYQRVLKLYVEWFLKINMQ